MKIDKPEHDSDARFDDLADRRTNRHIRRGKVSRRRDNRPKSSNSPGGIRQRRNKRWAW